MNVEINPVSKEFLFSCGSLKNNLLSQLSSYVAEKIFDDFNFRQTAAIHSQLLNFPKISEELESVMVPVVRKKEHFLYSFCKYVAQPKENLKHLHIFLFIFGMAEPVKARLIVENSKVDICKYENYTSDVMVNFLGERNTLVFAVPLPGATEYYVSNLGHHFSLDEQLLRLVHMKDWKDPQGRFNGSMVVDQKTSSVFVIGGFDPHKNDSLEYISCFLKCRWEKEGEERVELRATVEKSHKMFQGRSGAYHTGTFSTVFKNPFNESKITFKHGSFLIYYYSREYYRDLEKEIEANNEPMKRDFLNLGGALKDPTIFATGRFSTKKPGIRYLKYDPASDENPIINESEKGALNFAGKNYILIELPHFMVGARKRFRSHCLVFGGQRDSRDKEKRKDEPDFRNIYCVDTNNLEKTATLSQTFTLSGLLPETIDQFAALLKIPNTQHHYLRATYPLRQPVEVKGCFVHYLILEFGLHTGLFEILPGRVGKLAQ
jgi:hypothetical protein